MKQLLPFLLLLILSTYCHGQDKTKDPVTDVQTLVNAGIDPYFVESTDTISTHGPNCITRDVLQDRNGNYWFATWHGIIKYDGKLFTNYTLKSALIHFHVVCCYEDKKGNLWFGTACGGVYRYDDNSFKLFTTKDGLVDNNVSCVYEDKAGNIWLGTEHGVSRYDGKNFTNFKKQYGPDGKFVNSIIQDKTGKIWIGTSTGLYLFHGENFTEFKNKDGQPFKVLSLYEERSGNIWIGKWDGLTRYDGKSFTNYLTNYLTYYIIEDKAGNILLTHSETNTHFKSDWPNQILYKYDGITFTKVIEKYKDNDFQVFGKTIDRSGNIWFGTMHGPCRYNGKSFTYFTR